MQFRGPKLYKKKGALFQEESYLQRIFRSSSLNLHTFHLISIVFWWQIFFRTLGKLTPNDRQDRHVLVADVVIMTSQYRCTRALSQSHVAKHDNQLPVTPLKGSGLAVMSMQWLPYGKIISATTLKLYIQLEAIHPQSYRQLVHGGIKIPGMCNSSWNSAPFLLKSSGLLNCTFTHIWNHATSRRGQWVNVM